MTSPLDYDVLIAEAEANLADARERSRSLTRWEGMLEPMSDRLVRFYERAIPALRQAKAGQALVQAGGHLVECLQLGVLGMAAKYGPEEDGNVILALEDFEAVIAAWREAGGK